MGREARDGMSDFLTVIDFAMKLKKRMQSLNKRDVRVACPNHDGKYIRAILAGRKDHIHMACEVDGCGYRMME